jgi:hypothetical protein
MSHRFSSPMLSPSALLRMNSAEVRGDGEVGGEAKEQSPQGTPCRQPRA